MREMLDNGQEMRGYLWDVDHGTVRTWRGRPGKVTMFKCCSGWIQCSACGKWVWMHDDGTLDPETFRCKRCNKPLYCSACGREIGLGAAYPVEDITIDPQAVYCVGCYENEGGER